MAIGLLQGMRVAILATDGFEETELLEARRDLENAGATTFIVAPSEDKIKGWNRQSWGAQLPVDIPLKSAKAEDFHALFLPGEVMNPDQLRRDQEAVRFVKDFVDLRKPVAAINHGLGMILEAGAVQGRTMTSWRSPKSNAENASANRVDREVVCDRTLVTSRRPGDIPAFDREMIRLFAAQREHSTDMRKFW